MWSAEEAREFLDSLEGDRLYTLWVLMITTGVRARRGARTCIGRDVDLAKGRLAVGQRRRDRIRGSGSGTQDDSGEAVAQSRCDDRADAHRAPSSSERRAACRRASVGGIRSPVHKRGWFAYPSRPHPQAVRPSTSARAGSRRSASTTYATPQRRSRFTAGRASEGRPRATRSGGHRRRLARTASSHPKYVDQEDAASKVENLVFGSS